MFKKDYYYEEDDFDLFDELHKKMLSLKPWENWEQPKKEKNCKKVEKINNINNIIHKLGIGELKYSEYTDLIKKRNDEIKKPLIYHKYILNEYYDRNNEYYIITIIAPGLDKNNIELQYYNDNFYFKYNGLYNNKEEIKFEYKIKTYEEFKSINIDEIRSTYSNGILNIYINRKKENKKFKINIES